MYIISIHAVDYQFVVCFTATYKMQARHLPRTQGDVSMATDTSNRNSDSQGAWLSLDAWAVVIALLLALAVKFNIFHNVPW
jgi:hypothetical protein